MTHAAMTVLCGNCRAGGPGHVCLQCRSYNEGWDAARRHIIDWLATVEATQSPAQVAAMLYNEVDVP